MELVEEAPVQATTSANLTTAVLLEFSILLTSSENGVNLGQLENTLEEYLQKGMSFPNLKTISMTLLEGDSEKDNNFVSTSARFSGFAEFNGLLPDLADVQTEQGVLLNDMPSMQSMINENEALQGVSVAKVSFNKIDAATSLDVHEVGRSGNGDSGVLLIVVVIASVLVIASALLIVRQRRLVRQRCLVQKPLPAEKAPFPIPEDTKEQAVVDSKPGCRSLYSGEISLNDGDLSTYMMTASPKTGALITTSPQRPREISIRQTDGFDDDDDNYLTTDETSIAL
jgi:hypothetical protein